MKAMLRDVWKTAKSRPGWSGMLFCISPVGTAALLNYFSGIAMDYKATAGMVVFVNGALNGLITAVGSVAGGWICDRMDRRLAYLISGVLTAVVGIGMALAPLTPTTYADRRVRLLPGVSFCYAAFLGGGAGGGGQGGRLGLGAVRAVRRRRQLRHHLCGLDRYALSRSATARAACSYCMDAGPQPARRAGARRGDLAHLQEEAGSGSGGGGLS